MKLAKFDKNKKVKQMIVGSIVGIVLVVSIITLYKTFAFYEEEKSFNILKGRVPSFSKSDITLAFTIDGVASSNAFPNKSDGYVAKNVTCENGVTAEWDNESWGLINIVNPSSKKIACTIDFIVPYTDSVLNGADPILADNLVPVVIDEAGNVTKANTSKEWYNYEKKEWANAVKIVSSKEYANEEVIPESDIESYFVWIPRYKYKIFDDGNYSTATTRENAVEPIEIVFEDKSATPSNGVTVGSYLTHPAFTAFDVNGLWVGKFETGYKNAGSTSAAQVNAEQPANIVIKPNVYSWREINASNAFYTSYNYLRDMNSHMMKNMEWGAVNYLTNSIYGRCTGESCEEIRINNNQNYVTGYAATEASKDSGYEAIAPNSDGTKTLNYKNPLSVKASTTGNYSGIYDMSGGAWEYVMGVMNDTNGNPASGSTASYNSGFKGNYTNESGANTTGRDFPDAKYYDTYAYSTSETDYARRILGDATGEMGPFSEYRGSWYEDYARFVSSTNPWFIRGGYCSGGTYAGVFGFGYASGRAYSVYSFRVVLAPEAL